MRLRTPTAWQRALAYRAWPFLRVVRVHRARTRARAYAWVGTGACLDQFVFIELRNWLLQGFGAPDDESVVCGYILSTSSLLGLQLVPQEATGGG